MGDFRYESYIAKKFYKMAGSPKKSPAKASPKKASPKKMSPKKKASPKKKKATKAPAHPKFIDMIEAAIAALKERGGSSRQAIAKFIKANYKVGDSADTHIRLALRRAAGKSLIQVKGTGASGSFKVAPKPKPAKKKVKKAKKPAKKAAAKPAKKAKKPKKKTAKKPM